MKRTAIEGSIIFGTASYKVNVAKWVALAQADPIAYQQRQTVDITLNAIAMTAPLKQAIFLKGGILMGLAYDSPRQTADIDLTATSDPEANTDEKIRDLLSPALPRAAAALGYADLFVKIHSVRSQPKAIFEDANFPALKLKIAAARRGTEEENALREGRAAGSIIDVDISFNEASLQQIQVLELTSGQELLAYGLVDLIAEKYRAMLQQVPRNRNRRQDVYDLDLLIARSEVDDALCEQILESLIVKCQSRCLNPTRTSLDDPDIKERSGNDWHTLELELGEVPDFEGCFARVLDFYRNLPWNSKQD